MSDHWQTYLTNVNGELASIRFDLGPAEEVPDPSKPWLHWVWVQFRTPRKDGLSSGDEAARLWEIEDALVGRAAEACGAVHVGCITTQGRREFYFYAPSEEGFGDCLGKVLHSFSEYKGKVEHGSQLEPDWNQYVKVLHPSEHQMDAIMNRELLEAMVRKGDIHERERVVSHYIYFKKKTERTGFLKAAQGAGYAKLEELDKGAKGKVGFGVIVQKAQGITQQQIDATTRELRGLARGAGGDYDGWEALVVTR